jgi:hypothetical protein
MTDKRPPDPVAAEAVDRAGPDLKPGGRIGQSNIPQKIGAQVPPDFKVRDGRRIVGAVIRSASGYAAHGRTGKLGLFTTAGLALAAVRSADRAVLRRLKR